jgi:hypothetical protein
MRSSAVPRIATVLLAVMVAGAAALMLFPVEATYLNDVRGADVVEYRTASCGAPIASLLGADPEPDETRTLLLGG